MSLCLRCMSPELMLWNDSSTGAREVRCEGEGTVIGLTSPGKVGMQACRVTLVGRCAAKSST